LSLDRFSFNVSRGSTPSSDTTLSIALPVPLDTTGNGVRTDFQDYVNDVSGPNYVFPELYARVRTAEAQLQSLGIERFVLLGFSLGSRMAAAFMARGMPGVLPVTAYAGIGMYANSIDPLNVALTLDEIAAPVLDLFGSEDTPAVAGSACGLWVRARRCLHAGGGPPGRSAAGERCTSVRQHCATGESGQSSADAAGGRELDTAHLAGP
jgi:hypothetical protein